MQPILAKAGEMASHSVSRHARLFVTLVCVAIALAHVWGSWSARNSHLEVAHVYSGNMAKALTQHALDTFQATDALLLDVADRINTLGLGSPLIAEMGQLLQRLTREMSQLDGLLVFDELGNRVVNSVDTISIDQNNSDRAYFIYHRDHTDATPLIGPVLRSRSTGRWAIPMSRRLNHRDGSFAGVVVAALDLEYFTGIYRTFNVGEHGAISLLLRDGTMLTRQPFDDKFVNRDMSDGIVFRQLLELNPRGHADIISRFDQVSRLVHYDSVQKYPLVIVVALSQQEALAEWRQETWIYSIGVLVLMFMIALFGWRLIGQIELRLDAEMRAVNAMNDLQEANRTLETLAHRDGLTGLANRRHFDDALVREYRRASREGAPLSLILVDVDCFKQYNDIYGHQAGDECLRQVAGVLKEIERRPGDLAARYGGEELLMLLPATSAGGAALVAEKIRAGIQALAIPHSGNPVGVVTVSAGVNCIEPGHLHSPPLEELVGQADAALYQAKRDGRNQVRVAQAVRNAA